MKSKKLLSLLLALAHQGDHLDPALEPGRRS